MKALQGGIFYKTLPEIAPKGGNAGCCSGTQSGIAAIFQKEGGEIGASRGGEKKKSKKTDYQP